ncbi:MAG: hypothetical protein M0011_07635 [Elusimicrobia bacterium]|nr:hypothetical protein [Elusimicrobiota bacterium]
MKYWAYVNNEILGPFEKEQLRELPAYSPSLLVCPQTPVGEKTADWKEISSYPELGDGAPASGQQAPARAPAAEAPAPGLAAQPEPAKKPFAEPAIEPVSLSFKKLGGGQSVDPAPPSSHAPGLGNIEIAHFGSKPAPAPKPAQEQAPAQEPAQQSSSAFDPISLSQIVRRGETISGQEAQSPRNDEISLEPRTSGAAIPPQEAAAPEPQQAPAPVPEPARIEEPVRTQFPPEAAPAAAPQPAAQPVMDVGGLERLIAKLDALSRSAATKNDVEAAVSPLRQKLDQLSLQPASSSGDSQFQRQVMEKLYYLETSVGDLKKNLQAPPPAAAKPAEMKPEPVSETVFGVQPAREPENKKKEPEPQKETAKQEIKDEGTKKSNLGMAVKKVLKLVVTLVLLAAVLLGAVIGLKNFGIFDATKFIPFQLPFVSAPAQQPAEGAGQETPAPEQAAKTQPEQEAPAQQPPAAQEAKAPAIPPEVVPEMIYITRTFAFKNSGETLENTLAASAEKSGGTYSVDNWVVSLGDGGKYSIVATVPSKTASLVYAFTVDREKKLVEPANDLAKALFADAAKKRAPKRAAQAGRKPAAAARKPAAKAAAKPKRQPAKAAAKPAAEDEYEYVYEDEE